MQSLPWPPATEWQNASHQSDPLISILGVDGVAAGLHTFRDCPMSGKFMVS